MAALVEALAAAFCLKATGLAAVLVVAIFDDLAAQLELKATAAVFEAFAVGLAETVAAELTEAVALDLEALTAASNKYR